MSALTEDEQHEVGTYEDLRSLANRMVWTIHMQLQRLRDTAADARADFVLQPVSDAEFLVLSLDRFAAAARRIDRIAAGALAEAIREFDGVLSNLRAARNVIAHTDEYLAGDGRNSTVTVGQLSAHVFDSGRLDFAGFEFDLEAIARTTSDVFKAIQENPPQSYTKAVLITNERAPE